MNRLTLSCLLSSFLFILGCQQSHTTTDTGSVQESIEKIKTKIQEGLNEKKVDQENKGQPSKDAEVPEEKDSSVITPENEPNSNEPNSAD